jgi:cell division protein ZapA
MQELLPVNIVIADRNYRIRIEKADEEKVRKILKRLRYYFKV